MQRDKVSVNEILLSGFCTAINIRLLATDRQSGGFNTIHKLYFIV